jgi:DNA-binding transcriptional ArsR family regulator
MPCVDGNTSPGGEPLPSLTQDQLKTPESDELDGVFNALANAHRREIVRFLGQQPAAIHHLADMRGLSLPAINKHIGVLEGAGLIKRHKRGRTTFLTLNPAPLTVLQQWAGQFQTHWGTGDGSFDNYDHYLTETSTNVRGPGRTKGPS